MEWTWNVWKRENIKAVKRQQSKKMEDDIEERIRQWTCLMQGNKNDIQTTESIQNNIIKLHSPRKYKNVHKKMKKEEMGVSDC